jgi:hypothetical protein
MAVIKPVVTNVGVLGDESVLQIQWTPVTNVDTCQYVSYPGYSDKSIQVSGNFGGSASVALNGSNETANTNPAPLNDPSSTVIALTAAGIKAVLENTLCFQPAATGGGGTQSLTITMLVRINNTLRK